MILRLLRKSEEHYHKSQCAHCLPHSDVLLYTVFFRRAVPPVCDTQTCLPGTQAEYLLLVSRLFLYHTSSIMKHNFLLFPECHTNAVCALFLELHGSHHFMFRWPKCVRVSAAVSSASITNTGAPWGWETDGISPSLITLYTNEYKTNSSYIFLKFAADSGSVGLKTGDEIKCCVDCLNTRQENKYVISEWAKA